MENKAKKDFQKIISIHQLDIIKLRLLGDILDGIDNERSATFYKVADEFSEIIELFRKGKLRVNEFNLAYNQINEKLIEDDTQTKIPMDYQSIFWKVFKK